MGILIILTYNRDLSEHCIKIVITPSGVLHRKVYFVLCLMPNRTVSLFLGHFTTKALCGFREQLQLLYLSVINDSSLDNLSVF